MSELKPCPFCGKQAELVKENHGFGNPFVYRIGCLTTNCCGRRPIQTGWHTEKAAVGLWNTRVQETKDNE